MDNFDLSPYDTAVEITFDNPANGSNESAVLKESTDKIEDILTRTPFDLL